MNSRYSHITQEDYAVKGTEALSFLPKEFKNSIDQKRADMPKKVISTSLPKIPQAYLKSKAANPSQLMKEDLMSSLAQKHQQKLDKMTGSFYKKEGLGEFGLVSPTLLGIGFVITSFIVGVKTFIAPAWFSCFKSRGDRTCGELNKYNVLGFILSILIPGVSGYWVSTDESLSNYFLLLLPLNLLPLLLPYYSPELGSSGRAPFYTKPAIMLPGGLVASMFLLGLFLKAIGNQNA